MKKILLNLSLLLATTLLFFGGIELTLRVTGLQTVKPNPPQIYQKSSDPRISYELIPGISRKAYRQTVTVNSLGFRSPELDPTKDTIVMLGDSIAFGYGLKNDETLAARLEKRWPEFNVLNTAVPGYHLGMETAVYETKLATLPPVALLLVFHYNDFEVQTGWLDDLGIIRSPGWKPQGEECSPVLTGILGMLPGRCWLDLHSAFYKAVKKLVNMRVANDALAETLENETLADVPQDTVSDEQMEMYLAQLDDLVAILPPAMPRIFILWPDRYLHTESRPRLKSEATKRGFRVIDLYDTFGNAVEILGWDTVHPSAKSIERAAEVIVEELSL